MSQEQTTQPTFADAFRAKVAAHPRLKKLDPTKFDGVVTYFDSWAKIRDYGTAEDLARDFELDPGDAGALRAVATSEAAVQQDTVQLNVNASMQADVTNGQPAQPVSAADKWRAMREGGAPVTRIAAMVTNFNMRADAVNTFASAAYALFADAYGVDLALMDLARKLMANQGPRIKDNVAKQQLFDYYSMKTEGDRQILSEEMRQQAWNNVGNILDGRFDKLVGGSAAYAGLDTERQTMGAMVIAGGQQISLNDLIRLVSPMGELITTGMDQGFVGPLTTKVIREHEELVQPLLTNRAIQVAFGIDYNEANPLISGAELLSVYGMDTVNAIRTGVAYRQFINSMALAAVSRPDAGLIVLMGGDAADILTFGSMLNLEGAQEVAPVGMPFREQSNVRPPAPQSATPFTTQPASTSRGWKVSLRLGINFSATIKRT